MICRECGRKMHQSAQDQNRPDIMRIAVGIAFFGTQRTESNGPYYWWHCPRGHTDLAPRSEETTHRRPI